MKFINRVVFLLVLISLLGFVMFSLNNISLISALGVGAPYSGSNLPLEISPGEEEVIQIFVFNFDDEEDVVMQGELLSGGEIASLDGKKIEVPYESKEVFVEMIVKIPENAEVGSKYNIVYEFKQVDKEGEGMVSFSQGIRRNFDINIIEEILDVEEGLDEKKASQFGFFMWLLIILGIIIFVSIIVIIWILKKKIRKNIGL